MSNKKIFDMGKNTHKVPKKTWINLDHLGGGPPEVGVPLSPNGKPLSTDRVDAASLMALQMGLSSARKERFQQEYQMNPHVNNNTGDYPQGSVGAAKSARADELLRMLSNEVISQEDIANTLGFDWEKEKARRRRHNARNDAARKRESKRREVAKASQETLLPFLHSLHDRDSNGWFKRGDVSRVMKITPKEAGKLLRSVASYGTILRSTNDGWWICTMRRQQEASFGTVSAVAQAAAAQQTGMQMSQPQQKIYNVFGGK